MFDLFNQPPYITHGRENNPESEAIYVEHEVRLNNNARVILKCLQEGQRLTGVDCQTGIKSKDMDKPIRMSEYRKRFFELIHAGHPIKSKVIKGGNKIWWIGNDVENFDDKK